MLVIKRPDSREFIVHLNCITIIILLISHKAVSDLPIATKPDYYLLEGDSTVKTKDLSRVYKTSYRRIVIDLLSQHFISYIYIHCNGKTFSLVQII